MFSSQSPQSKNKNARVSANTTTDPRDKETPSDSGDAKYWREDYKTTHTHEELLKKQEEIHEIEARTPMIQRAVNFVVSGGLSAGHISISVAKGTIALIFNPGKIPGALSGAWKTIKHEAHHYWMGFKLMGKNIATASSILHTALSGKTLTRRERRMLRRTAVDIFRLVPFSIFVIIPFMELLLPVALRLFPTMLPSSFKSQHEKEDKLKKDLQARLQMASFLQETVEEMLEKKMDDGGKKEHIIELLTSVRSGHRITNEQLLKVAAVFKDDMTLENMPRPQLVSLCQYMKIRPFGSTPHLRWVLSQKMKKIKEDDEDIEKEGVETLTIDELRSACSERGMRTVGLTTAGYRKNLNQWLNLSLNQEVPVSLLILSRAFTILERQTARPEDFLKATISAMDEDMVEEVLVSAGIDEDVQTKLEVLERENEMIEEESEEREKRDEIRRKVAEAKEAEKEKEKMEKENMEKENMEKETSEVESEVSPLDDVTVLEAKDATPDTMIIPEKVLEEVVEDLESLVKNQAVEEERDFLEHMKKEQKDIEEDIEEVSKEGDEDSAVAAAAQDVEEQPTEMQLDIEKTKETLTKTKLEKETPVEQEPADVDVDETSLAKEEEKKLQEEEERLREEEERAKDDARKAVAGRLKDRVQKMLTNIEKRIEAADKEMETLNVLDTDGDGVITESELTKAIIEVLSEHNSPAEAQAIAKEVLSRAGDKLGIGVSTEELMLLAKEFRSKQFKKTEDKSKKADVGMQEKESVEEKQE